MLLEGINKLALQIPAKKKKLAEEINVTVNL